MPTTQTLAFLSTTPPMDRDLLEVRVAILNAIPDARLRDEVRTATESIARAYYAARGKHCQPEWLDLSDTVTRLVGAPRSEEDFRWTVRHLLTGRLKHDSFLELPIDENIASDWTDPHPDA